MNIEPINSYNIPNKGVSNWKPVRGVKRYWRNFKQGIINIIPEKNFDDIKNFNKWEKYETLLSEPAANRAIMLATGLAAQPAIDYYNHRVDEETRIVSRNRTLAKVGVGGVTGIIVRELICRIVDIMANIKGTKKYSKWLIPLSHIEEFMSKPKFLKNHKFAIANFGALAVMAITNFIVDAPLTVYFTNKLNKKSNRLNEIVKAKKLNQNAEMKGVENV